MEKFIYHSTYLRLKELLEKETNKDFLIDFSNKLLKGKPGIKNLNPAEQLAYRNTLKYLRDLKNSMDTSYAEGKLEGKIDMVIKLVKEGSLSLEKIATLAQLSLEEVQQIAQNR